MPWLGTLNDYKKIMGSADNDPDLDYSAIVEEYEKKQATVSAAKSKTIEILKAMSKPDNEIANKLFYIGLWAS